MRKLRFLVALTTNDNDYQIEQARAAEQAAKKFNVDLQILYADNDAINQSTQILKAVQAAPDDRPVAQLSLSLLAARRCRKSRALRSMRASAGRCSIATPIMFPNFARLSKAPVFTVSSDHVEIGRIQGRQCAALLPTGGTVLYIQGPSENSAAKDRTLGMQEAKPHNIHLITLKGQWTEESSQRAVRSWLKLSTSQKATTDLDCGSGRFHGHRSAQGVPGIDRQRWNASAGWICRFSAAMACRTPGNPGCAAAC